VLFDDLQRIAARGRLQHGIAARGKGPRSESADRLFVLDEEDRAMASEIGARRGRLYDRTRCMGFVRNIMGQKNRKNRPLPNRARTEHVAAGLLHNAVHHGEAETGAFSDFLGGKKRFEDFVFYFRRDAMSEILDLDCDIIAWIQRSLVETGAVARHDIAGPQDDLASLWHRVARIH